MRRKYQENAIKIKEKNMTKHLLRRHKSFGKSHPSTTSSREKIAQHAAKLLLDGTAIDYPSAKRKAAKQLGFEEGPLPSDFEVEEKVYSYQQLFQKNGLEQRLATLRQFALRAMKLFESFSPCLVGPVLMGTITEHSVIELLVFADPLENIDIFLIEKRIPYKQALKSFTLTDGTVQQFGIYRIQEKDVQVEIMALPTDMWKKLPLKPKDNSLLYRGARIDEVQGLIGG